MDVDVDMVTQHCITSTLEMFLVNLLNDTVVLISLHVPLDQTYLQHTCEQRRHLKIYWYYFMGPSCWL